MSPDKFPWPLRPGTNHLAARTLNYFGVFGPVSTAEIHVTTGRD